jgi:hypothetical protein
MEHESNYYDNESNCDNCGLYRVYWDQIPECPAFDDSDKKEEEEKE